MTGTARARLLVAATVVGTVGWGAILPYQYAYASTTRGWGGLVAALASSLFSVGALVAAPLGGRLADRVDPGFVTVGAKLVAAVATASLVLADSPLLFCLGMGVFGAGLAASAPAQMVLVLRWIAPEDRRRVFALLFTGVALGMGIGAFAAGYLVDLSRTDGMLPAFTAAAVGFVLSAGLVALARRGAPVDAVAAPLDAPGAPAGSALRVIASTPTLRWAAVVTVTLALGFYAQFGSGLPAYGITVLGVSERTVGTAAGVNCLVIVAIQMAVVRWTAHRPATSLLVAVGMIWVLAWLLLASSSLVPALAGTLFVVVFAVFAVGETMYAPVLNPLTASLAPSSLVGATLGIFAALQTGASAAGPLLAGLALGSGHGTAFVAAHVGISAVAVGGALRLRHLLAGTAAGAAPSTRVALAS